jgi:hypothetical protein
LSGEQDFTGALARTLGERDRQARDGQAGHRHDQHHPPLDMRLQEQAEPSDARAEQGGHHPDRQRPQEFSASRRPDMGKAGDRQRERAKPGPGVKADKYQRAYAGSQQSWHQH